ncbi:MAG: hypothetical protein AABX05_03635, partial [Nanoarchaeota archaeon]
MRKIFKVLAVLLLVAITAVSALATINATLLNPLWDNDSKSETINNGGSAVFTTGYFGSNLGSVHVTITLNDKERGNIVSTLVSKDVDPSSRLGFETVTVTADDYQNKAGQYIVVIKLQDANHEVVDASLLLNVRVRPTISIGGNDAPIMNIVNDKEVTEAEELVFRAVANDVNNDDLTYNAQVCTLMLRGICVLVAPLDSIGANLNPENGLFSWMPDYEFVQHPELSKEVMIRIQANDGRLNSNWEYVTITVNDKNRVPYFSPRIPREVTIPENQLYMLSVYGLDADKDRVAVDAANLPLGAQLVKKGNNAVFSWRPSYTQAGTYYVQFIASDNFGGAAERTLKIIVTNVQAPQCSDGRDNDGDGLVDMQDPGCTSPQDDDENNQPNNDTQCSDHVDNDGDGLVDMNDPGCTSPQDDDEDNQPNYDTQCSDGADNDGDGVADIRDPGCHTDGNAGNVDSYDVHDNDETDQPNNDTQCSDHVDNDGDGLVDMQ